jgi:hypothetical protein
LNHAACKRGLGSSTLEKEEEEKEEKEGEGERK